MKQLKYIIYSLWLATLAACDKGDMPVQHPDNYDWITFAVQTRLVKSRASSYEAYDPTRHPNTMGVFGYYDMAQYSALTATQATTVAQPNPIYDNATVTYDMDTQNWSETSRKRWDAYKGAASFDFFAYMPRTEGTKVMRVAANTYTLSVPFTMPDAAPLLSDSRQAPIICTLPEHKEGTTANGDQFTFERVVKLRFDQTLTAYRLLFQLDGSMGAIRQFHIKSVTLSGNLAVGGTVSRTYTWDNGEWNAQSIQWTVNRQAVKDAPIAYANNSTDKDATAYDDKTQSITVTADGYKQWGGTFYVIPDAQFRPTISVTYDVVLTAQDSTTVTTRKNVTSNILLNTKNFDNLTIGSTATVNPIRILIQPRYLYVLADDDAYTGHLLID